MNNLNDWFGAWNDPGWIAVYVIVALLLIGALVAFGLSKKRKLDHQHAEAMRTNARRQQSRLGQQDAEARRLEAESEQARAEADRLEAEARDQRDRFERERSDYERRLHEADKIDPRTPDPGSHRGRHDTHH